MPFSGENNEMRRKYWCLALAPGMVFLIVAVSLSTRPRPVNLNDLKLLRPVLKEGGHYPGITTYIFRQSAETVKSKLDERLNKASGWDSSGYPPAGSYWYRPQGWEGSIPRLLSEVGIGRAELNIEFPDGTELTILRGSEISGL